MPSDCTMQLPRLLTHLPLIAVNLPRFLQHFAPITLSHGFAAVTHIVPQFALRIAYITRLMAYTRRHTVGGRGRRCGWNE